MNDTKALSANQTNISGPTDKANNKISQLINNNIYKSIIGLIFGNGALFDVLSLKIKSINIYKFIGGVKEAIIFYNSRKKPIIGLKLIINEYRNYRSYGFIEYMGVAL